MKSERENCGFDGLMVAYIYDEATSAERRRFEGHLLDCSACTDEFASLSNARLSVFEWQKEDFAELETPRFDIPYDRAKAGSDIGWLATLQGVFAGFRIPIAAAAGVLVVLGLGLAAFMLIDRPEKQIAANIEVERAPIVEHKPTAVPEVIVPAPQPVSGNKDSEIRAERQVVPAKAAETTRARPARPAVNQTAERRGVPNRLRKAPALSDFEEADDRSLRLTDLFEGEIGGIY
jgi:anti-sigma factor RsiW